MPHRRADIFSFRPPRLTFDGEWVFLVEGVPVHAASLSYDEAASEFLTNLVWYAEEWASTPRLARTASHAKNRRLVEAVLAASHIELVEWVGRARLLKDRTN